MHKLKQEHQSNRTQPYTDSRFMTAVPFGAYSPWLQPWRGMLETIPVQQFLDGIGIVFNPPPGSETPLAKHLARYGFTQARVEIPWNHLDMSDRFTPATSAADQRTLQTLVAAGIRPLILLYAHQGAPCPLLLFTRTLAAPARKGDRSIHLTDTSELVVGRSGISNLSGYWAAEALVLRIEGEEVFLSKPLPKDLGEAGKAVSMATLKYAPFGPPESAEYRETMSGWKQFIGQVVGLANEAIGVGSYDLEIWNELTFGSNFLAINKYHERPIATYNERELWGALVRETAAWAEANPAKTRGVRIADGFSNTIPWPSAAQEPERVSALCKHPYAGRRTYPKETPVPPMINALFQSEAQPRFRQSYTELFPEYFATWLQTESILRDAAPQTTEIYKVRHGRLARPNHPCPLWLTEIGTVPSEDGITDPQKAHALKAKVAARTLCFYLNKGIERVYLFAAVHPDTGLGVVRDEFIKQVKAGNAKAISNSKLTSPTLQAVKRIIDIMRDGLAPVSKPRALSVEWVADDHNQKVFDGDGTPEHPPLYHRDVLAVLPYQVSDRKFVLACYVMTRDVAVSLPSEPFEVRLSGLDGRRAKVRGHDPLTKRPIRTSVTDRTSDALTLQFSATDYPYLIQIEEK